MVTVQQVQAKPLHCLSSLWHTFTGAEEPLPAKRCPMLKSFVSWQDWAAFQSLECIKLVLFVDPVGLRSGKYSFHLDPAAGPTIGTPRKIPLTEWNCFQWELDPMGKGLSLQGSELLLGLIYQREENPEEENTGCVVKAIGEQYNVYLMPNFESNGPPPQLV